MQFKLNDPSNYLIIPYSAFPARKTLTFNVNGMTRINTTDAKALQAANCFIHLTETINFTEHLVSKFRAFPTQWAGIRSKALPVYPRYGRDFNAYYDRVALRFFYNQDPITRKTIYTANSTDIVGHELGHAILDVLRPDFWDVQALEIWALHEAFGDIVSISANLVHSDMVQVVLTQTGGALRTSNMASKLAEEMGAAIYHVTGGREGYRLDSLRDASTVFKYVDPQTLPKDANDDVLSAESHSFSRVLVSAWYEILVKIFEKNIALGMDQVHALFQARNDSYLMMLKAVASVPKVNRIFEALARVMISNDEADGGKYASILKDVFSRWNMWKAPIKMLDVHHISEFNNKGFSSNKNNTVLHKIRNKCVKLSDIAITSLSLKSDPDIEIAADEYMAFSKEGYLVDHIKCNRENAIEDASICFNNFVSKELNKTWNIKGDKLRRKQIRCCLI